MVLHAEDDAIRVTMRQASDMLEFAPGLSAEQLEQAKAALPDRLRHMAREIEAGRWEFDGHFHEIPIGSTP